MEGDRADARRRTTLSAQDVEDVSSSEGRADMSRGVRSFVEGWRGFWACDATGPGEPGGHSVLLTWVPISEEAPGNN